MRRAERPRHAGHRVYSTAFLRIYDALVLGVFSHAVWRCPTGHLLAHYERNVGQRHLDIGPGTGYFLANARLPADMELTLLDPNTDVLTYASRRLRHLRPTVVRADICAPIAFADVFDSIALNYVLHCLPGPMHSRTTTFDTIATCMANNGVLFGATVLGTPDLHTSLSRLALRQNNRVGIFDNLTDTRESLYALLERSFGWVDIRIVGSVAVFAASQPR